MITTKSAVLTLMISASALSSWNSAVVTLNKDSTLTYARDSEGSSIPDYSWAGFANGEKPIPTVKTVITVEPGSGDQTAKIQKALDSAGSFPADPEGVRGAVLLKAGTYELRSPIYDTISGVVLRGESDSAAIIRAVGDSTVQKSVLFCGGRTADIYYGKGKGTVLSNITSDTVFVGDRTFSVEDGSKFQVGDTIVLWHPCTPAWVTAIGGGDAETPWSENLVPVCYIRTVRKIDGNSVTIDAPVFMTMVKSLSQAYIYTFSRKGLKQLIGIENIRFECINSSSDTTNENHPKQVIDFRGIDNGWIKNCTMSGFVQSGVIIAGSTRITVDSCRSVDPMGLVTGERFYNFHCAAGAQQILFSNCYTRKSRHAFVANGAGYSSGIAVVNCRSDLAYTSSEGHRWWSTGMLFDRYSHLSTMKESDGRTLGFYDRTGMGTQHGWGSAFCTAWNCSTLTSCRIVLQKPKTAQNWAVGCFAGTVGNEKAPNAGVEGYVEGTNTAGLEPQSLYAAQLAARLKGTAVPIDRAAVRTVSNWSVCTDKRTITVTLPDSKPARLSVCALNGKILFSKSFEGSIQIETELVPKGCFIIIAESGSYRFAKKLALP